INLNQKMFVIYIINISKFSLKKYQYFHPTSQETPFIHKNAPKIFTISTIVKHSIFSIFHFDI
ncbi:hypothetical protein, partial [Acinetobacter colistiniresistens]|uniref:hypothetical protein n=1 Tax=Acinetobacter colistiniresistens TaxID=280145 RepID=UPI001C06AC22